MSATQAFASRAVFSNVQIPPFGSNVTVNTSNRLDTNYNFIHFSLYSSSELANINAWAVESASPSNMLTTKFKIYRGDTNRELRYNQTVKSGTLVSVRVDSGNAGHISGASNII